MWTLKKRQDGSFYLNYDKTRRFFQDGLGYHSLNLPGQWELIGRKQDLSTGYLVAMNRRAGYFCVDDDEGGIRALILEYGNENV